jgi:hypothetical protein
MIGVIKFIVSVITTYFGSTNQHQAGCKQTKLVAVEVQLYFDLVGVRRVCNSLLKNSEFKPLHI